MSTNAKIWDAHYPLLDKYSTLPIASLSHTTVNIGDEVQTLAADQFAQHIEIRFDREELAVCTPEKNYSMILNGWYCHNINTSFPPKDKLNPIFIGFHITPKQYDAFAQEHVLKYLRSHAPIGCRDQYTRAFLESHNVDAYFSNCLTLTFPKRTNPPKDPKIVVVDIEQFPTSILPKRIRDKCIRVTHEDIDPTVDRIAHAQKLLDFYRDQAGVIITSRLHCALPCTAMGIPVILFSDKEFKRMSSATEAGIRIYRTRIFTKGLKPNGGPIRGRVRRALIALDVFIVRMWYNVFDPIDWSPTSAADVEHIKSGIVEMLERRMKDQGQD